MRSFIYNLIDSVRGARAPAREVYQAPERVRYNFKSENFNFLEFPLCAFCEAATVALQFANARSEARSEGESNPDETQETPYHVFEREIQRQCQRPVTQNCSAEIEQTLIHLKAVCELAPGWARGVSAEVGDKPINIFYLPGNSADVFVKFVREIEKLDPDSIEFLKDALPDLQMKCGMGGAFVNHWDESWFFVGAATTNILHALFGKTTTVIRDGKSIQTPVFCYPTLTVEENTYKILGIQWMLNSDMNVKVDETSDVRLVDTGDEGLMRTLRIMEDSELFSLGWKGKSSSKKTPESLFVYLGDLVCGSDKKAPPQYTFNTTKENGGMKLQKYKHSYLAVGIYTAHEIGHVIAARQDAERAMERGAEYDPLYTKIEELHNIGLCTIEAKGLSKDSKKSLQKLGTSSPFVALDQSQIGQLKNELGRPQNSPSPYILVDDIFKQRREIFRYSENMVHAEIFFSLKERKERRGGEPAKVEGAEMEGEEARKVLDLIGLIANEVNLANDLTSCDLPALRVFHKANAADVLKQLTDRIAEQPELEPVLRRTDAGKRLMDLAIFLEHRQEEETEETFERTSESSHKRQPSHLKDEPSHKRQRCERAD